VATIKCTNCGLVNPDTDPVCRRCNEVLVLDSDAGWEPDAASPVPAAFERSAYDERAFPPPARDFTRERAGRVARVAGAAVAGIGLVLAVAGAVLSMRQFVFGGIATAISGWLVASGRMLGVYFYTLSWFLTIAWAVGASQGKIDAPMAVLTQMIVPSLVLLLLWWKLPAYLKLDSERRQSVPYGYGGPAREGPSPAVGAAAIVLGVGLIAVTAWGAFRQAEKHEGQPAAYWIGELDSPNPAVRRAAVVSLGNIDSPETIPYLAKAMGDEDAEVRRSAVAALSGKDEQLAVRPLKLGLWSDYKDVRDWSLAALQERDVYTQADSRIEAERANKVQPPRK
jgi:hypothetical protein